MTKKSFVVILTLSVVAWYISRYVVALFNVFVLKNIAIDIFGRGCLPTGYPLFYCVDNALSLILIGLINILIWFIIIHALWKMIKKNKKR